MHRVTARDIHNYTTMHMLTVLTLYYFHQQLIPNSIMIQKIQIDVLHLRTVILL